MMKHAITVTQKDIDEGVAIDCEKCPIARAIAREFPGRRVNVLGDVAILGREFANLPDECAIFVHHFDNLRPVQPFSFILDLGDSPEGYAIK
jgi:hypothetical protein